MAKRRPLVSYFEGDTRVFYKYPMSVTPYLLLPKGFELYWQETPEIKSLCDFHPYNRPSEKWFEEERLRWISGIQKDANSRFDKLVKNVFREGSDFETLRSIIDQHGLFNYNFFRKTVWTRVAKRFAVAGISVDEICSLVMELERRNPNWQPRGIYLRTAINTINEIFEHLYEQTVLELISIEDVRMTLKNWFDRHVRIKKCKLCEDYFKVVDVPKNYYYGSNGCYDCCFGCLVVERPLKEELMELIPAFTNACGFIPSSKIGPTVHSFMSRIPENRRINVFRTYAQMGGIDYAKGIFGSWFHALAETKILPSGVLPSGRGFKCLAEDGHICYSIDEQYIDNWLSSHGIKHEREPAYPIHPHLNFSGRRRPDWKVNDTFVEYFGLIGDEDDEQRMAEKILLAEISNIKIISLYPSNLTNLEERLSKLS